MGEAKGPSRKRQAYESLRATEKKTFRIEELLKYVGSPGSHSWDDRAAASSLAYRWKQEGKIVQVGRGLFGFPEETTELTARQLHWEMGDKHWLSHRSAMAAHGFGPPLPHEELVVTSQIQRRARKLPFGPRVRFVVQENAAHAGVDEWEIEGIGSINVADIETTILDGLEDPQHSGGIIDVARYLAWSRGKWDPSKLVKQMRQRGNHGLERRLGCLVELAQESGFEELRPLKSGQRPCLLRLDLSQPNSGDINTRWRIRVNVPEDGLTSALRKP